MIIYDYYLISQRTLSNSSLHAGWFPSLHRKNQDNIEGKNNKDNRYAAKLKLYELDMARIESNAPVKCTNNIQGLNHRDENINIKTLAYIFFHFFSNFMLLAFVYHGVIFSFSFI